MKKKTYIKPEVECIAPFPLMAPPVNSIGVNGHVRGEGTAPIDPSNHENPLAKWPFGGTGGKDDDPDANDYSWDDWDV